MSEAWQYLMSDACPDWVRIYIGFTIGMMINIFIIEPLTKGKL